MQRNDVNIVFFEQFRREIAGAVGDDFYHEISRLLSGKNRFKRVSMEAAKQFLYKAGICETPLIWAVEDARKVFIGYVIYHTYDETSMELGWVLERKEWGKGYASAITKVVTEESGSSGKELVIECSPEQKATKRIAQKYGFQFCSVVNGCEVYRLRRK